MRKVPIDITVFVVLLASMIALMWRPLHEESATMDESLFLAAGYGYCHGYGFSFDPQQPPLAKMITAVPLWFMDVKLPSDAQRLWEHRVGLPSARAWSGSGRPVEKSFSAAATCGLSTTTL